VIRVLHFLWLLHVWNVLGGSVYETLSLSPCKSFGFSMPRGNSVTLGWCVCDNDLSLL
jgi:hypothetical protein